MTPNVTPVQHVEGARCFRGPRWSTNVHGPSRSHQCPHCAKATHGLLRTCYLSAAVAQCLPCAHVSDACVLQVLIRVHCCTMLYLFIFPAQVEDLAADTWKFVEDFNDCKEVNYLCNQKHQWSSIITNFVVRCREMFVSTCPSPYEADL